MIYFFYTVIVSSAILMLFCTNPINSVLFLIFVFLNTSIIFFLIGCDFIGLVFIIIYLGAIAVLFLFIVMMVNIKKIEGDVTTYLVVGSLFFLIFFFQILYYVSNLFHWELIYNFQFNNNYILFDSLNKIDFWNKKEYFYSLGRVLYLDFFLFMVMLSILLLIGMFGSIFLTNYKNNFSSKKQFNQIARNYNLFNIYLF